MKKIKKMVLGLVMGVVLTFSMGVGVSAASGSVGGYYSSSNGKWTGYVTNLNDVYRFGDVVLEQAATGGSYKEFFH